MTFKLFIRINMLLLVCLDINPATIGSDSAVNRFNTQIAIANTDRVAGFAMLAGGFTLTGTAQFDSFFPVSGPLNFNNATLNITRDFYINDVSTIPQFGHLIGNFHTFDIASTVTCIPLNGPAACVTVSNIYMFLNGNLCLDTCITFTGTSSFDGQGKLLSLTNNGIIRVGRNSSLALKDITIQGIKGSSFQLLDSTSSVTFQNVNWVQDSSYTFSNGRFDVYDNFKISGPGTSFIYSTNLTSTINDVSRLSIDEGVTFRYAPTSSNRDLISLVNVNSSIELNGATLSSTTTGLRLTSGTLQVNKTSYIDCDATNVGQAISFGNGTVQGNLEVHFASAASLEILKGIVVFNEGV